MYDFHSIASENKTLFSFFLVGYEIQYILWLFVLIVI